MALATQCPHCKTIFRVAQDQLKLRGGIVRCGACHEIFDGNASLVDLHAATAAPTEAPLAAPADADNATLPLPAAPVADASDDVPVYALDLGAALDPLGILPKPEGEDDEAHGAGEAAGHPTAATEGEPAPVEPAEENLDAEAAAEHPGAEPAADEAAEPTAGHAEAALAAEVEQPETAAGQPSAAPTDDGAADAFSADEPQPVAEAHQLADEPASASHDAEPVPAVALHEGRVEPTLDEADEELVTTVPADEHELDFGSATTAAGFSQAAADPTPLLQRESTDGAGFAAPPPPPPKSARARQLARRSKLTPTKIDAPKLRVPEIDEPEFVKRGRQREQWGKRRVILLAAGSVVLALALAVQAAVIFRNDLVARMPGMRPALTSMCSMLRCRVELPARIDNLTIETGELQTLAPGTYVLATLLHNQGGATQAWPDIELALTDATDKPLVRRVFAPADYLPKGAAAAGFAAHGEQSVRLYFQLDQLKPSGYHIAVFYP